MIICSICTGRHETHACVIARARVEACMTAPRVDDYANLPSNVIPFPKVMHVEHEVGRASRHYNRTKRDYEGIRVTRLA